MGNFVDYRKKDGLTVKKNRTINIPIWQFNALRLIVDKTRFTSLSHCVRHAVRNYLDYLENFDGYDFRRNGCLEKKPLLIRTVNLTIDSLDEMGELAYKFLRSRSEIIRFAVSSFLFDIYPMLEKNMGTE